jgi:hypothetical protein
MVSLKSTKGRNDSDLLPHVRNLVSAVLLSLCATKVQINFKPTNKKRKKMEITITIKADKEELSALRGEKKADTSATSAENESLAQRLIQVLGFGQQAV